MKATNQKKQSGINPKLSLFKMMMAMFMLSGISESNASKKSAHVSFMGGGSPEFYPRKHTVMNYATQNRIAKKHKANKSKK